MLSNSQLLYFTARFSQVYFASHNFEYFMLKVILTFIQSQSLHKTKLVFEILPQRETQNIVSRLPLCSSTGEL